MNKNKKAQSLTKANMHMNTKSQAWTMYTHFGKDDIVGTAYYNEFQPEQYFEYYWELVDYLRSITTISPNDYHFKGLYFEPTTNSIETMYTMSVHSDDSVSFDYDNRCIDFKTIRVKMKDIFKIFKKKKDALYFMLYCMKCFSSDAK